MQIAIIGLSCKFPQANTAEEFWNNLLAKQSCIAEIPDFRWDWRQYWGDPKLEKNKSLSKWAGLINDVDAFDAGFFGLLPKVVKTMDPQQRIMLELAWACLEDAGIAPTRLRGSQVGVFCGVFNHDYKELQESGQLDIEAHHSTGTATNVIANRISHFFDFTGPSFPIDTACSSSLNAIHSAIQAIESGDCELALAGGVNLILTPTRHISFSKMGMLSASGRCSTFDESADGYVRGEGAALVLLKPLDKALEDGDAIHGVIKGSAVNHCGATYTLTYPSADAQAAVIMAAHAKANVPVHTVNYVETHGTGTPKGDPIEIEGLVSAYTQLAQQQSTPLHQVRCGLSAVKTNIGHLEAAAGVAGLIKLLQSFKHQTLAPLQNFNQLNHRINLDATPFYVVDESCGWQPVLAKGKKTEPLRGGISSFGFGGTNAHIIVEQAPVVKKAKIVESAHYLILLSAKTVSALQDSKSLLVAWMEKHGQHERLIDISAGYALGRDFMPVRAAYVVRDHADLVALLKRDLQGNEPSATTINVDDLENLSALTLDSNALLATMNTKGSALDAEKHHANLQRLSELFIAGASADFAPLFTDSVQRLRLPTYPFARDRFWLERDELTRGNSASILHPVLHENISTLEEQRFRSTFTGAEFFLRDHQVMGQRLLPAAAYLEIACAAYLHALPQDEASLLESPIELRDLVFLRPFIVAQEKRDLSVRVFADLAPASLPEDTCYIHFDIASGFEQAMVDTNCYGTAYRLKTPASRTPYPALPWVEEIQQFSAAECYEFLTKQGFGYGKTHQSIAELKVSDTQALVELSLPDSLLSSSHQFLLHPSIIDGALQAAVALLGGLRESSLGKTFLPFAIEQLSVFGRLSSRCFARIDKFEPSQAGIYKLDIAFFEPASDNAEAQPLVVIRSLTCREAQLNAELPAATNAINESIQIAETNSEWPAAIGNYYSPAWTKISTVAIPEAPLTQKLLLLGDAQAVEAAASRLMLAPQFSQATIVTLSIAEGLILEHDRHFQVAAGNLADYEAVVEKLKSLSLLPDCLLVIHDQTLVDSLGELQPAPHITAAAENIFLLLKASFKAVRKLRIVSVAEGSLQQYQPIHQGLSGFYKSIRLEKPTYTGRVVLFDRLDFTAAEFLDALVRELSADDTRVDLAYQQGEIFAREFMPFDAYAALKKMHSDAAHDGFREQGNYLISGGLGALGMLIAGHLISTYKANVYLTGRSTPDEKKLAGLAALCVDGGSVNYLEGDVTALETLTGWIASINAEGRLLNGVIHSAGVIEDNFLIKKELSAFQRVIAPKVKGALALDFATRHQPLDVFVLFSSVTGIFGNLGQCDYGYGNSFEDYFSHARAHLVQSGHRSGASVSINWPYWKDGGMQLGEKEEEILFKNFGITPLANHAGIAALEFAARYGVTQMAVLEGDQQKIRQTLGIQTAPEKKSSVAAAAGEGASTSIMVDTAGMDIKQQAVNFLIEFFAHELKIPRERFDLKSAFQTYGFDSVVMIDMVNLLEKKFVGLPRTLFFEYQNIDSLADFLVAEYAGEFSTGQAPVASTEVARPANVAITPPSGGGRFLSQLNKSAPTGRSTNQDNDIAIVGVSGRFPEAENISEFWDNLKQGRDCITEVPAERGWAMDNFFQQGSPSLGNTYAKWGGFLKNVDQFDPLFFNISPKEAEEMDPHERLFLETAFLAIADAGYRPDKLAPTRGIYDSPVGVYVGMMWGDYHLYSMDANSPSTQGNPHSFYWAVANRVSYQFNFSGPSITIDTACSSSITAIHLACDALKKGEIDAAVAGGVNLSLHPVKYTLLSNLRFLSTDGRCRSFGTGGDGYVPAEAVGAVILKRKSDAIRDGDHIYGVIKSTAINHGGRTSGFTVPNPNRQGALIKDAIQAAAIDPRDISYVEAHGTGTSLGDPIEISGLSKAFAQNETGYCAIGSAKSNIGHAEAAAGVAGLIKILLQLKHQQIAPSLHSGELNPYAKIDKSPFVVQQSLSDWVVHPRAANTAAPLKRMAALSSFGAGGANGHLIVEEYLAPARTNSADDLPALVLLSARKESSLLGLVSELRNSLATEPVQLHDLAYTLQTGRMALDFGCALVVNSIHELEQKLTQILNGTTPAASRWGKRSANAKQEIAVAGDLSQLIAKRDWVRLADAWMSGEDIDWEHFYLPHQIKRIPLPGYVFDKSRYWVAHPPLGSKSVGQLSPLVDKNISTLDAQLFEKVFLPSEFYLRDHRVGGSQVLPGVVYLEMVLQAAAQAAGANQVFGLANVAWLKPVIVDEQSVKLKTGFYPGQQGVDFEIFSDEDERDQLYCQGQLIVENLTSAAQQRHFLNAQNAVLKPAFSDASASGQWLEFGDINAAFDQLGFDFGETFQVIKRVQFTATEALGELALVNTSASVDAGYRFYPSLFDGAIRCAIAIGGFKQRPSGMPLPVAVERVVVHGELRSDCVVLARALNEPHAQRSRYDVFVFTKDGTPLLSLYGFQVQWVATLAGVKPKVIAAANTSVKPQASIALAAPQTVAAKVQSPVKMPHLAVGQAAAEYLKQLVADVTKVPEAQIGIDEALERYGIDSVMIMAMNERLRERFGADIPQTLFFEYQNIADLAGYFTESYPEFFVSTEGLSVVETVPVQAQAHNIPEDVVELDDARARTAAIEFLLTSLAQITKISPAEIDPEQALEKYGVDSVMIMGMNEKIAQIFGDQVSKTLFYEYQDLAGIADYFVENHRDDIGNKLFVQTAAPRLNASAETASAPISADRSQAVIAQQFIGVFAEVTGVGTSTELLHRPLSELEIDAVAALQLQATLRQLFPTIVIGSIFSYPTIQAALHDIFGIENFQVESSLVNLSVAPSAVTPADTTQLVNAPTTPAPTARLGARANRTGRFSAAPAIETEIAIVGLAGRYPQADNLDAFWSNLAQGRDLIVEVPADRWDHRKNFSADRTEKGKIYGKWGGFLERIDLFDPDFFRITQREAEKMDPQERFFLETAWECFEDAGYNRRALKQHSVGVFVGVMWGLYQQIEVSERQRSLYGQPASPFSSIANRVSYTFDLDGPSIALDTMCSSSITAIHMACQSIRNSDCTMAVAGGINLASHPLKYQLLSQEQFLSTDGRCRAFGEGGSGYVPGEGSGAVLLKSLSAALADGDHIYGVIKASALNHGGKTNGYTVPNQKAQTAVIAKALKQAAWPASSLSYIEAHGTGTSLGDPIEVAGLTRALNDAEEGKLAPDFTCDIGSVKTNIGHLESAAGIAALTKVLLQLKHQQIAPSLHSATLNKNINFNLTPLRVPQQLKAWDAAYPRRAGISSFGAGGSNSHLLIEEYQESAPTLALRAQPMIFVLSADDTERLFAYAERFHTWLADQPRDLLFFHRLAYTTQVGRDQLPARLALVTDSIEELQFALAQFLEGGTHSSLFVSRGEPVNELNQIIDPDERQHLLERVLAKQQWARLAQLWAASLDIDWQTMSQQLFPHLADYPQGYLQRVSMPAKPFMHRRVGVEEADAVSAPGSLHPFIDQNRSTLFSQLYAKTFTGKEFYLADHVIDTGAPRVILPGVAYLELARACAEQAVAGAYPVRHIRNLLWVAPVEINGADQEVLLKLTHDDTRMEFEVFAEQPQQQVFCQGEVAYGDDQAVDDQWLDLNALIESAESNQSQAEIYNEFRAMGFAYGESYRVTRRRYRLGGQRALTELKLPDALVGSAMDFVLHPSLLDAALRTGLAADFAAGEMPGYPIVPFAVEDVEILHPMEAHCFALASKIPVQDGDNTLRKYRILVVNPDGKILVKLHNFTARAFIKEGSGQSGDSQLSLGLYPYQWSPQPLPVLKSLAHKKFLVMGLDDAVAEALAASAQALVFSLGEGDENQFAVPVEGQSLQQILLKRDDPRAFESLLVFLQQHHSFPDGIFYHASGLDSLPPVLPKALADLQQIYQAFERVQPLSAYKLVFSQTEESGLQAALNASAAGFAKSLLGVNHRIRMSTLQFADRPSAPQLAARLASEMAAETTAEEICYRDGQRLLRCLQPAQTLSAAVPVAFRQGGAYLITGGLGKLGLVIARYLAQHYQAKLLLTGRSKLRDSGRQAMAELKALGATVVYLPADIARQQSVQHLIDSALDSFGVLHGVIHSAGVATAQTVLEQDSAAFADILQPKLMGTLALDEATRQVPLDFFVLFSSISALVGDLGSGSYACANRFLDAFAEYRQELVAAGQRKGLTLSINWPLWAEGGMAIPEEQQAFFEFSGIHPLTESQGIQALGDLLRLGWTNGLVAAGNPRKLQQYLRIPRDETQFASSTTVTKTQAAPILDEPVTRTPQESTKPKESARPKGAAVVSQPAKVASVSTSTPAAKGVAPALAAYLVDAVAAVTKIDREKIDSSASFERFGMDSVMLMELQSHLKKDFTKLPKTALFEYDSLATLGDFIGREYADTVAEKFGVAALGATTAAPVDARSSAPSETASMQPPVLTESKPSSKFVIAAGLPQGIKHFPGFASEQPQRNTAPAKSHKVAIIGMAGRFPKSTTLDEFWSNLTQAVNTVEVIPSVRWNADDHYAPQVGRVKDKSASKWGGFIDALDDFDNGFFRMSKDEACKLDPQVKLALEMAWGSLEDAGYTPQALSGHGVGVFMGTMSDDFTRVALDAARAQQQYLGAGHVASEVANRVSFFLNLHGPSLAVQTACSSSAVALHLARTAILNGECDYALAGGVNVSLHPAKYLMLQDMRVLSPDGREATFDEHANGLVPSEGAGMVLLKNYEQALADGDRIYGVLSASATNHAGTGAGQFMPNLRVLADTATKAITESGVAVDDITYIECHGTGTELGDPIELKAMETAIASLTPAKNYCALGTKANLGHMEAASGICSLIKVLLSMKHGVVAPCANLTQVNSVYDREASPFVLPTTPSPWAKAGNGLFNAGINSFGMGGANAFLVVSSEPVPARVVFSDEPLPVLFSAQSAAQVQQYVQQLIDWLGQPGVTDTISWRDLAFTTQVGRVAFEHRLAIVANNLHGFIELAQRWLANPDAPVAGLYRGHPSDSSASFVTGLLADNTSQEYLHNLTLAKSVSTLASLWVFGAAPDWRDVYGANQPRRISLPGYPYHRTNTHLSQFSGYSAVQSHPVLPSAATIATPTTAAKELNFIEGEWHREQRDDLNIVELVVGMEDRFANYIFGGDEWKAQYWDDYLNAFQPHPATVEPGEQGDIVGSAALEFDAVLVKQLQHFSQQYLIEPKSIFVAAFALLLSRLGNSKHAQFACEGIFHGEMKTLPYRVKCQVKQSSLEWLHVIQTERLIKFSAFDALDQMLAGRNLSDLYDSVLCVDEETLAEHKIDQANVGGFLNIKVTDVRVTLTLNCRNHIFAVNGPEKILQYFQSFVAGIIKNPQRNPATLPMQSAEDKKGNFLNIMELQGNNKS